MGTFSEYRSGYFPLVNKTGFFESVLFLLCIVLKLFVKEAPTANRIRHVHIHNSPWRQHGFLVRVFEVAEDFGDHNYASGRSFLVCRCCQFTNAFTRCNKDISIVVFCKVRKNLFCHALRHELLPRLIIHKVYKAVNINILFNRNICAVNHQGHTNRNTAKDIDSFFASLLSLFLFCSICYFFRSRRSLSI